MKTLDLRSSLTRLVALFCATLACLVPSHAAASAKPSIYAFNVAAESTINLGTTTQLNWGVGNATSVTLSPIGDVTGLTSINITPTATTTYVLTATNSAGSVSRSMKVTVIIPPVFQFISASPSSINAGASTTLSWSAPGASYFTVTADNDANPGNIFGNSVTVHPKTMTTYTVLAVNTAGTNVRTITIPVTAPLPKPAISSFTASPTTVTAGNPATLTWAVTGATSLSIAPGIGAVTGTSISVSPTASTTYTLTATNSSGSVTKKVAVTVAAVVQPVPVINSFTASPGTISIGASTTLNWLISDAATVSIAANVGASPGAVSGSSISVSPTANTTYTITAANSFGSATKKVSVTVTGPAAPVIGSFFATPAFIQVGDPSTLTWSVSGADSISIAADVGTSPGVVTGTSISVSPTASTTYTLSATNTTGTSKAVAPVTIFTPGNGSITHPRIWVTPATLPALSQRVANNDPAWIRLRNECDAFVGMGILFPDQDPAGDTINGGYEFNDYLLPSEELALGYLASKTADPVRAARYAAKEKQLLLALSDPVHHGRPTTDSGYSIRSYVPALALGYDWIYETLTDSDRAQIFSEINRWVTSFDQQGFGRNFPQGNYFAGYYCAKALGALATEGENPNAATMWNDWLNRIHYGMVQPYHAKWLSGGGAPDGWNYGPFETINMIRPIAAALTAKGLDLIHDTAKPMAYFDGHARWMTQFTWPDLKTVSDRGFVYEGDDPTSTDSNWSTQYNGLLHLAHGDNAPLMQRYTLDIRATRGTNDVDPWVEFLFQDNAAPVADYRIPLSYHTTGDGQVAMRSAWTSNAVWATFQSGPLTNFPDSAEELFDQGSLAIQRGNVQFVVNPWGALMRNTPGTSDGNNVFNDVYNELFSTQTDGVYSGRRIFNTYYAVRTDGYWGQVGNGPGSTTTFSRFEEGGGYVLMRGAHLEDQYLSPDPISSWTRTIAYVRPQLFVVYDRTTVNNANVDNWIAWHVGATPVEQPAVAGTHRFDVVDTRAAFGGNLFRGRVTTVLPAGHLAKTVNVFNRGKVYRLELRNAAPSAASTWLTVFDASASAGEAASAAPLAAVAGNVMTDTVEGTVISGANGHNVSVLFSKTGGAISGAITIMVPAVDTYCLVNDLQPNTGYSVSVTAADGNFTLQFTPGGAFTTTANGSLPLNLSVAGAVSTP